MGKTKESRNANTASARLPQGWLADERIQWSSRRAGLRSGADAAAGADAGRGVVAGAGSALSAILQAFGEDFRQAGSDDLASGLLDIVADAGDLDQLLVRIVDDADGVGVFVARL